MHIFQLLNRIEFTCICDKNETVSIYIIRLTFKQEGTFLSVRLHKYVLYKSLLLGFSLTEKAATLIFISGCGSAIPSAKEGKSGFIYDLVKS